MAPFTGDGHADGPAYGGGCDQDGGCRYLRSLSRIEELAGFTRTAQFLADTVQECDRRHCPGGGASIAPVGADDPIVLPLTATPESGGRGHLASASAAAPIPLSRSSVIDIASDALGNRLEQRQLKLDGLDPDSSLGQLHDYWQWLRSVTACGLGNIDTAQLARAGVIGRLHLLDVSSGDPEEFQVMLFGYAIPLPRCDRPRALPVAIYADQILRDYNTVRLLARPRLHRVRARLGDKAYHYTRLILPFMGRRGEVTHLAVAIHREPGDGATVAAGDR